jgi:hypothetical protein
MSFVDDFSPANFGDEGEWENYPTLEDELAFDKIREEEAETKELRKAAMLREFNILVAHWEDVEGWHLDDEQYADRQGPFLDYAE